MRAPAHLLQGAADAVVVVGGQHLPAETPARVNDGDLPDPDDLTARGQQRVEDGRVRRFEREVLSVRAQPLEGAGTTGEGPGDHPRHGILAPEDLAGGATPDVEGLQGDDVDVRR